MNKPTKMYHIVLDGIDKTGKDLIRSYIYYLGNAKYICTARGFTSMVAYSNLYNRPHTYDVSTQTHILNVLLTVEKEDWIVRCNHTKETQIDYEEHTKAFEDAFKILEKNYMHTLRFNTTHQTPYVIAKLILQWMNRLDWSLEHEAQE